MNDHRLITDLYKYMSIWSLTNTCRRMMHK